MNEPLYEFHGLLFGQQVDLVITGWKIIGYTGVALFSGRWVLQMYASRKAGRPVFTKSFWLVSTAGSLMALSYFIFSNKSDSVGVLQNLFPSVVASYNLYLEMRYHRENGKKTEAEATLGKAAVASPALTPNRSAQGLGERDDVLAATE